MKRAALVIFAIVPLLGMKCAHEPLQERLVEVAAPCIKKRVQPPAGRVTDAQLDAATVKSYAPLATARILQDRKYISELEVQADTCAKISAVPPVSAASAP